MTQNFIGKINLLTVLSGLSNLKRFMNDDGTDQEWDIGIKIGSFTIDTATLSGSQSITGVGFKPSNVIFLASISLTAQMSIGFDNGVNAYSIYQDATAGADRVDRTVNRSIRLEQVSGSIYYLGYISSLDSDGFTITWTKGGAKTGTATIFYIAFR